MSDTDPTKKRKLSRNLPEPLWTADDLSAYLRLPRRRIYHEAKQGNIPHIRIGRKLRFVPEKVRDLIDSL